MNAQEVIDFLLALDPVKLISRARARDGDFPVRRGMEFTYIDRSLAIWNFCGMAP